MRSSIVLALLNLIFFKSLESCDITHECPIDNDVKWATNGTACHVFLNDCFLDNVNCHHRNNNDSLLEVISKDECQRLCVTKCPEEDDPVCGYYNGSASHHTFANRCQMEAHICKTGETLFVYGIGPCENPDEKQTESSSQENL